MKIYSIVSGRIPTEKAHGFQVVRMCQAFVDAGAKVVLVSMGTANPIQVDIQEYYGFSPRFAHLKVKVWDGLPKFCGEFVRFLCNKLQFTSKLFFMKVPPEALIYSRDPLVVFLFSIRGFRTLYDAHNYPTTKVKLFEFFLKRVSGVIANSRGTAGMFPHKKTLVAPNGVDLKDFESAVPVESGQGTVLYSGHLYSWKGVDTVLGAAALRPDLKFVFLGGTAHDLEVYRKKQQELGLKNVVFEGHIFKTQIPARLLDASVVLLPNNPGTVESEKYTSPIKMFEYLASGVPLIASDLPSLREVLDESVCTFFKAGDPADLARALDLVLREYSSAKTKAMNAKTVARQYSWDSRASRILDFIQTEICVE